MSRLLSPRVASGEALLRACASGGKVYRVKYAGLRSPILFATASLLAAVSTAQAEPIAVKSVPVPLSAADPAQVAVGALRYRGGLVLTSEHQRFGGLSGLRVSADGKRLEAVSDEGHWFTARLVYDRQGRLAGLADAEIGALLDPAGKPLRNKIEQDAEALTALPDGSRLVGFERHHRILRYPKSLADVPQVFPPPPGLEQAPLNEGLESLVALSDGSVLALTEDMTEQGLLRGWLWRDGRWSTLRYRLNGAPRPSDATTLPGGDLLVLERSYSPLKGLHLRLVRVALRCIKPDGTLQPQEIAELRPPLTADNLEGVSVRRNEKGETIVYLLSDDNFSGLQRTLLMMFALEE